MKNLEALSRLCNAIANTFYPDSATLNFALFNEGIDSQAEATPKDVAVFRVAIRLVMGYVESSRSENGVSTSVREDSVKDSLSFWCKQYGLDADEELNDYLRTIDNATNLW